MTAECVKKALSALGLCRKAGGCVLGTDAVCEAMRNGRIFTVVSPADNAENTKKKITDKCRTYGLPLLTLPVTGEELAHAVGKTGHISAVGIAEENFVSLIRKTVTDD